MFDLEALKYEQRNQCHPAFLANPNHKKENQLDKYLAWRVNSDTFSDSSCGDIGQIGSEYVQSGKKWCCETSLFAHIMFNII